MNKHKLNSLLRRNLTVNWAKSEGELDLRYHSLGIGGIHSMPAPATVVEKTALLKPRSVRIFLQEFFYVYPATGVYDWAKLDAYMDAVHAMVAGNVRSAHCAYGGDIMASICLKPNALYPIVDETIWQPNDVAQWQELIHQLVLRYSKEKNYVTHWAIANEQNIGETGGCPYLITNPDDYFEYYKITAAPIIEALPNVKVGGPSHAGGGEGAAQFLERFIELCKRENIKVDFTCYNAYCDDPARHVHSGRTIRNAIDKHDPSVELYMTEFNVDLIDELSVEEEAYDPRRAASLASSILALHEDGCLNGSYQYHIYDQFCDPAEFAPWYAKTRYMAEHWSDLAHRLGLFDMDGKARPQYYMYKLLYEMTGTRAGMCGTDNILRGIASQCERGSMSIFLANFAVRSTPDAISLFQFENAKSGLYRLNVYRIDENTAADMKATPTRGLAPTESRVVYIHPDFHFHVYTPADSVTLVQLTPQTPQISP